MQLSAQGTQALNINRATVAPGTAQAASRTQRRDVYAKASQVKPAHTMLQMDLEKLSAIRDQRRAKLNHSTKNYYNDDGKAHQVLAQSRNSVDGGKV